MHRKRTITPSTFSTELCPSELISMEIVYTLSKTGGIMSWPPSVCLSLFVIPTAPAVTRLQGTFTFMKNEILKALLNKALTLELLMNKVVLKPLLNKAILKALIKQ